MNTITWLLAGAALGWLASIVVRRRRSAHLLNIMVGMVGALLAGYLLSPVFGVSKIDQGSFNFPALMVSMGGAAILLIALNFLRRENNVKKDVIEAKWELVRSRIHVRWDKLTEEDIAKIDGNHSQLIGTLMARYGFEKKEAEDQIQRYLKSVPGIT